MGHPDFRVRGKIFATLGYPDAGFGMVKLTPSSRRRRGRRARGLRAVKGGWGRGGATRAPGPAKTKSLGLALTLAWRNVAPGSS